MVYRDERESVSAEGHARSSKEATPTAMPIAPLVPTQATDVELIAEAHDHLEKTLRMFAAVRSLLRQLQDRRL